MLVKTLDRSTHLEGLSFRDEERLAHGRSRLSGDQYSYPAHVLAHKSFLFKPQKYTEIRIVVDSTFAVNNLSKFHQVSELEKLGGAQ